jgi:hypothetical protein
MSVYDALKFKSNEKVTDAGATCTKQSLDVPQEMDNVGLERSDLICKSIADTAIE